MHEKSRPINREESETERAAELHLLLQSFGGICVLLVCRGEEVRNNATNLGGGCIWVQFVAV